MTAEVSPALIPAGRGVVRLRRVLSSGLFDFVGQQIVWWSAVALVRIDRAELGALPALALIAVAGWARGRACLALSALGVLVGLMVDGTLIASGAMTLTGPLDAGLTSSWMLGLWAVFGLAFSASMRWLVDRSPVLALSLGAIAGSLAYRAGDRLGVLDIAEGPGPQLAIGALWALAVGTLQLGALRIHERFEARR